MFETAELGLKISKENYSSQVPDLRVKLLHIQEELKNARFPVLILISGADAAGKGEVVNVLHEWLDPRFLLTYGFAKPSEEESQRPEYWRFWRALPPKGRIGILFGSWYTDPILKYVHRKISGAKLDKELQRIRQFERLLADDGALIIKFWFHLSKDAQKKTLTSLSEKKATKWRVTKTDWQNFKLYDKFRKTSERAVRETSTGKAPWTVIEAVDRRYQCLTVGNTILDLITKRLEAEKNGKSAMSAAVKPASKSVKIMEKTIDISHPSKTILDTVDMSRIINPKTYKKELPLCQARLNDLYRKAKAEGLSSILVFEGWDAGGKGGTIRRLTAAMDSRDYRVIPIAAPTDEEKAQHYLWRFWRHLPGKGRVLVFDRSWYGRVMVERVEGFASEDAWSRAYSEINDFEAQLVEHGYLLMKFFLHITPEEQLRRFKEREKTPWKQFKITDEDWRNREKWAAYEDAVNELVERTSTEFAPWNLIAANDKPSARISVLKTCCRMLKKALD